MVCKRSPSGRTSPDQPGWCRRHSHCNRPGSHKAGPGKARRLLRRRWCHPNSPGPKARRSRDPATRSRACKPPPPTRRRNAFRLPCNRHLDRSRGSSPCKPAGRPRPRSRPPIPQTRESRPTGPQAADGNARRLPRPLYFLCRRAIVSSLAPSSSILPSQRGRQSDIAPPAPKWSHEQADLAMFLRCPVAPPKVRKETTGSSGHPGKDQKSHPGTQGIIAFGTRHFWMRPGTGGPAIYRSERRACHQRHQRHTSRHQGELSPGMRPVPKSRLRFWTDRRRGPRSGPRSGSRPGNGPTVTLRTSLPRLAIRCLHALWLGPGQSHAFATATSLSLATVCSLHAFRPGSRRSFLPKVAPNYQAQLAGRGPGLSQRANITSSLPSKPDFAPRFDDLKGKIEVLSKDFHREPQDEFRTQFVEKGPQTHAIPAFIPERMPQHVRRHLLLGHHHLAGLGEPLAQFRGKKRIHGPFVFTAHLRRQQGHDPGLTSLERRSILRCGSLPGPCDTRRRRNARILP